MHGKPMYERHVTNGARIKRGHSYSKLPSAGMINYNPTRLPFRRRIKPPVTIIDAPDATCNCNEPKKLVTARTRLRHKGRRSNIRVVAAGVNCWQRNQRDTIRQTTRIFSLALASGRRNVSRRASSHALDFLAISPGETVQWSPPFIWSVGRSLKMRLASRNSIKLVSDAAGCLRFRCEGGTAGEL